jgi:hypothetical protein
LGPTIQLVACRGDHDHYAPMPGVPVPTYRLSLALAGLAVAEGLR